MAEETANEQLHEGYVTQLSYICAFCNMEMLAFQLISGFPCSLTFVRQHPTCSLLSLLFLGHLMTTMNLRSFKSLERLGIKWKNWSYQTCQHKIAFLDFLGLPSWKTDKVIKGPLGWMHRKKIDGYKDRQRKGLWHLSYADS